MQSVLTDVVLVTHDSVLTAHAEVIERLFTVSMTLLSAAQRMPSVDYRLQVTDSVADLDESIRLLRVYPSDGELSVGPLQLYPPTIDQVSESISNAQLEGAAVRERGDDGHHRDTAPPAAELKAQQWIGGTLEQGISDGAQDRLSQVRIRHLTSVSGSDFPPIGTKVLRPRCVPRQVIGIDEISLHHFADPRRAVTEMVRIGRVCGRILPSELAELSRAGATPWCIPTGGAFGFPGLLAWMWWIRRKDGQGRAALAAEHRNDLNRIGSLVVDIRGDVHPPREKALSHGRPTVRALRITG